MNVRTPKWLISVPSGQPKGSTKPPSRLNDMLGVAAQPGVTVPHNQASAAYFRLVAT